MGLIVIDPGMLTTVQDAGRMGYMDCGFPPAGALDGFSFRLANFLVGNESGEAVLEMTMKGASFLFDSPALVALAGADMKPLLNGFPVETNRAFEVTTGDILHTGFAVSGVRAYLAAAGGFAIEPVMGSRSTNLKARVGGYEGRALQSKDRIAFRGPPPEHFRQEARSGKKEPLVAASPRESQKELVLRLVEGPQTAYFTPEGLETFYNSVYAVRADSDRMGVRLEGPVIEARAGVDIVSDGIPLGAVQVPGSGLPIILMNDRQTTGGYAKIGAVITRDVWALAQARPGTAVRFEKISPKAAEKLYVTGERVFTLRASAARPRKDRTLLSKVFLR